ncbi:hypothetical protein N7449_004998, partial [Penicillium cf. viridicatum]
VLKSSDILEKERHNRCIYQTGISTGSVAIEVVTSVATSFTSLGASTLSLSVIKTESQDLPPLNAKKRVAESLTLLRKRRRHLYSTSQLLGRSQLVYRKRPLSLIKISRKMVNDTIQYLQTLSDCILISDAIPPREWATMYEEIIVRKEMETDAVSDFDSPPTQPEEKCQKCAAADEERLYD